MKQRWWIVLGLSVSVLFVVGCPDGEIDDNQQAVEAGVEEKPVPVPEEEPPIEVEEPAPLKHVYGFVYKSDLTKESMATDIEREQLTAVALHAAYPKSDGSITNSFDPVSSTVSEFIDLAHQHGVEVHINIALFSSSISKSVLQYHKVKMKDQIMAYVEKANLDGVHLDFENIPKTDYYRDLFADFVEMLSEELHAKNLKLFIAVGNRPGGDDDADRLSAAADGLFIMGYAYSGPWSTVAGPTAPFTTGGKWWASYSTFIFNPDSTKTWVAAGVDPKKLILGTPLYGYRWQTTGLGIKSSVVSGTAKALTQKYMVSQYGKTWDSYSQTPWWAWSSAGKYYQVWYDDAQSYAIKFGAANEWGFGGIGFWKLPWATDAVWEQIETYQETPAADVD